MTGLYLLFFCVCPLSVNCSFQCQGQHCMTPVGDAILAKALMKSNDEAEANSLPARSSLDHDSDSDMTSLRRMTTTAMDFAKARPIRRSLVEQFALTSHILVIAIACVILYSMYAYVGIEQSMSICYIYL